MLTRTYISKMNTIIKDDTINTGINPVSELIYGSNVTRILCYFNHDHVKELVDNKVYPDIAKLKHILKIYNAGAIDFTKLHQKTTSSISDNPKIRASSFDLIFFLIPMEWDGGKGFDYAHTFFNQGYYGSKCSGGDLLQDSSKSLSYDGSNWFQARNGYLWDEEGVYFNSTLSKEYDKFSSNEGSHIIIGRQHFDIGNEDINLDITHIFNKFLTGELKNYGIGIAYSPLMEVTAHDYDNYVGFFTNKTNTFFEPYIETTYNDAILDDRENFILNRPNRLYLYANIGANLENLDEIPTCAINDKKYEVKQATKGVYYVDVMFNSDEYNPNTMYYDVWGNIKYNGRQLDDVELEFVTKFPEVYFNIGTKVSEHNRVVPSIYGIKQDENIKRGDVRKVCIIPRVEYSKNTAAVVDDMYYRLYIKDGEREIDCIPYQRANRGIRENYFLLDTDTLIPNKYYLDIKVKRNNEVIISHNTLTFNITQQLNNLFK